MTAAARHLLLYDERCRFCRAAVRAVLAFDRGGRIEVAGLRSRRARRATPGLSDRERRASLHLVAPDGRVRSAEDAIGPILHLLRLGPLARAVAPGSAGHRLAGSVYRWIARNRSWLSRGVPRRAGAPIEEA